MLDGQVGDADYKEMKKEYISKTEKR